MKIEKLVKQLEDTKELYRINGIEVKQNIEAGYYSQVKSAQSRSMSLAKKIITLETKIRNLQ